MIFNPRGVLRTPPPEEEKPPPETRAKASAGQLEQMPLSPVAGGRTRSPAKTAGGGNITPGRPTSPAESERDVEDAISPEIAGPTGFQRTAFPAPPRVIPSSEQVEVDGGDDDAGDGGDGDVTMSEPDFGPSRSDGTDELDVIDQQEGLAKGDDHVSSVLDHEKMEVDEPAAGAAADRASSPDVAPHFPGWHQYQEMEKRSRASTPPGQTAAADAVVVDTPSKGKKGKDDAGKGRFTSAVQIDGSQE